jgi:hypothetical protein
MFKSDRFFVNIFIFSFIVIFTFSINTSSMDFVKTSFAQITPNLYSNTTVSTNNTANANTEEYSTIPGIFPDIIQEKLDISISPETPKPGEEVTIVAQTFGVNMHTNMYTWFVNNTQVQRGTGQNKLTLIMGPTGSITNIRIVIKPVGGPEIVENISFTPVDVDILWQSDTYTPPFYKGKALYSYESEVTFTALPNMVIQNRRLNPADVVYRWSIDYDLQNDSSGHGKNTFTYKGPIINRNHSIQAEVYASTDANIKGRNSINLNRTSPQTLIYEDHPLLGVLFNRNIQNEYFLTSREVKLSAYPLHFSTDYKNNNVRYTWSLDGSLINIGADQNSIIFRRTDDELGYADIGLTITNPKNILQRSVLNFDIFYDKINRFTGGFGTN